HVQKPPLNALLDVVGIAAVNREGDQRVFFLEIGDQAGEKTGAFQLSAADGNGSRQMLLSVSEIILRLFCQGYNFLRPAAQKHSVFGENDPMPVPMEQCDA